MLSLSVDDFRQQVVRVAEPIHRVCAVVFDEIVYRDPAVQDRVREFQRVGFLVARACYLPNGCTARRFVATCRLRFGNNDAERVPCTTGKSSRRLPPWLYGSGIAVSVVKPTS